MRKSFMFIFVTYSDYFFKIFFFLIRSICKSFWTALKCYYTFIRFIISPLLSPSMLLVSPVRFLSQQSTFISSCLSLVYWAPPPHLMASWNIFGMLGPIWRGLKASTCLHRKRSWLLHYFYYLPPSAFLYQLSHEGSPRILEWVAHPFSSGSSQPRSQTRVSWIKFLIRR